MIHLVLYQPEIPPNTGNIIRTAMATGSVVHLIKPYGFVLNEKHLKRAGMDYVDLTDIREHLNWTDFMETEKPVNIFFLTRYGHKAPDQFDFTKCEGDIYL
ncbi:MAG: tRNA (cytidine(34)-2'-O)-methyltransferase, partial [Erysipelotrichaceae bacterium]|nr:tRNA (cytidine(34)-2'-O)-methyltransferase [Erysipelotrichaceae bacterium]